MPVERDSAPTNNLTFQIWRHHPTGLMMALCNEISGLVIHANSDEEMHKKIPDAVRQFSKYAALSSKAGGRK